jgi:hypothetical protein
LGSVASAQSYSIRITFNTNLRTSYSLQADIIETAPAGTTLQVVGSLGRWLRISRNGSDVWLASWVRHERVEGTTSTPAQTVSEIDNCCFVDRQCMTDAEWTEGYWAFQNGQCAAPVQTQTQTQISSQPALAAPADANNCCFLGWQCSTDQGWAAGFYAFQENRCSNQGVAIEGSDSFVAGVEAALDLLKERSSYWYQYAVSGLDAIAESHGSGILNRTFHIHPDHLGAGAMWMAGIIVHDACHVHRADAGLFRYETPEQQLFEEKLCLDLQLQALAVLDPGNHDPFGLRTLYANIEDPVNWWWD